MIINSVIQSNLLNWGNIILCLKINPVFYSLQSNWCFIMIDQNDELVMKLIGHTAIIARKISLCNFPILSDRPELIFYRFSRAKPNELLLANKTESMKCNSLDSLDCRCESFSDSPPQGTAEHSSIYFVLGLELNNWIISHDASVNW